MSLISSLKSKISGLKLPKNRFVRAAVFIVPFAIIATILLGINFAGSNTILSLEGEKLTGGGAQVINSSSAYGDKVLKLTSAYPAKAAFTIKEEGYKLIIRGTGDSCNGAPELEVLIDNEVQFTEDFPDKSWKLGISLVDVPVGTHEIGVKVKNPYNNSSCRRAVYLDVIWIERYPITQPADTTQPTVSISSPVPNAVLNGTVTIGAAATDNVGIAKVEFIVANVNSGNPIGTDTSAPYSVSWDTTKVNDGSYTVYARATDTSGNIRNSSNVTFSVRNNITSVSGEMMPIGDLPGWKQIFTDDFATNVPLGSFPSAVKDKWGAYPYPWRDTKGQRTSNPTVGGWYYPEKTVSIKSGMMDIWLHTETIDGAQRRLVAAPQPKVYGAGTSASDGQLYGRYAVRFRSDPVPGFKTAWLLWPDSGVWPRDGEIDFPEGNLTSNIHGYMHWQNATMGSQQYYAKSTATYTGWHTAVIEWGPGRCAFYLDGKLMTDASGGKSEWTDKVPNTPMHWVLQTETRLDDVQPTPTDQGHLQIDWVAIWKKT